MSWFSRVPVIGAVESVIHHAAGNHRLADEAAGNTARSNGHVPLVGHLQGALASAAGEKELARESMRNSTYNMIPPGLPGRHLLGGGYTNANCIFPRSDASEVAKLAAFCASDVYQVRKRGGRTYRGVALNGRSFTIACNEPASNDLEFADYKIGNLVMLAFRGTAACATDWIKDVHVAIGTFDIIESLVSKAPSPSELCSKHGVRRISTTGHSLGGAAALVYANKYSQEIESCNAFNPGNAVAGFKLAASPSIQCHCIEGDVVSLSGGKLPSNTVVYRPVKGVGGFPSHGIAHFTYSDAWDRMIKSA